SNENPQVASIRCVNSLNEFRFGAVSLHPLQSSCAEYRTLTAVIEAFRHRPRDQGIDDALSAPKIIPAARGLRQETVCSLASIGFLKKRPNSAEAAEVFGGAAPDMFAYDRWACAAGSIASLATI